MWPKAAGIRLQKPVILVLVAMILVAFASAIAWFFSKSLYLNLGISYIGYSVIGVGFFQNGIYYSSIVTFASTFALTYYGIVQLQKKNPILGLVVSFFVLLSAAYAFEFVYEWFNQENLLLYIGQVQWWVDLVCGFGLAVLLRLIKPTRLSLVLLSGFIVTFGIWYLTGFYQIYQLGGTLKLVEITNPILPREDSIIWNFTLNALSKVFLSITIASLFLWNPLTSKSPKEP